MNSGRGRERASALSKRILRRGLGKETEAI
jgi:hypothetical protein